MDLEKVSRDDWIFGGVGLLLIIDVLFLPWISFSYGIGPYSGTATSSGSGAPDGIFGILAFLTALAAILDLAVERLSPETKIPAIGDSRTQTRLVLVAATAVFLVLKLLIHVSFTFNNAGFGFWLAIVLTAGFIYLALKAKGGSPAA